MENNTKSIRQTEEEEKNPYFAMGVINENQRTIFKNIDMEIELTSRSPEKDYFIGITSNLRNKIKNTRLPGNNLNIN